MAAILLFLIFGTSSFGSMGLIGFNFQNNESIENIVVSPPPALLKLNGVEKIAFEKSISSVGIQVFKDGKLVNQGNGIIISSDGLIGTVADLFIPQGAYQIFHEDKIIRGTVAAQDFKLNLMLLKTIETYSNVADLNSRDDYQSGKEILLVGKVINLGRPSLFTQKGVISYITEKTVILDASINNYLKGATVVDMSGNLLGLTYLRNGRLSLIKPGLIKSLFDSYIEKSKKTNNN